jgi:squalene-associated FAD-dependent desaturase
MSLPSRVVIVGGGWAGMAAALELDHHHIPFTLLESAPQLGGRARSVNHDKQIIDNGQHLLIGAYHETLRLLAAMGIDETKVLSRTALRLSVQERGEVLRLHTPPLPAPLHLLWALIAAKGIRRRDQWQALRMSLALGLSGYSLDEDCSVATLLARHRQGAELIRRFWEPLCIATLNTPLEKASAQVFLRVLRDSFTRQRRDADLLIPRVPLGALFPEAAATYLKQRHGSDTVRLRQRVAALQITAGRINDLSTARGNIKTDEVILAVSPSAATRLLAPHAPLQTLADQISQLGSQPIITAYLQFPARFRLSQPMLGLSGRLAQWLFDRRLCNQPGLIAVVISAEGEHCCWDNARLLDRLQQEIREEFPDWPAAEQAWVIREKRATFECRVGIESLRPDNATPVKGLWLAGDYTNTGYPATLEGAVLSGVQCARRLIEQRLSSD